MLKRVNHSTTDHRGHDRRQVRTPRKMWNFSGASRANEDTNSPNFQLGRSFQRSPSRLSSSIFGQPSSSFNFTCPSSTGRPSFSIGERCLSSFTCGKPPLFPPRSDGTSDASTQFDAGFTCLCLSSPRARRACALRALRLLLADGTPTLGGGKTF